MVSRLTFTDKSLAVLRRLFPASPHDLPKRPQLYMHPPSSSHPDRGLPDDKRASLQARKANFIRPAPTQSPSSATQISPRSLTTSPNLNPYTYSSGILLFFSPILPQDGSSSRLPSTVLSFFSETTPWTTRLPSY